MPFPSLDGGDPVRPRILVVDDDPNVTESLVLALKNDFDFSIARDATSALEAVKRQVPDLILLDISLGMESGVTLCYELRDNPSSRNVPVLILTGLGGGALKELAFIAGADDFLEKPLTPTELRARISSMLNATKVDQQRASF
jgi:DNA-binding response OmpR family regulator